MSRTRKTSAKANEEVKGLIIISVSLIILISLYTKAPGIIGLYVKNFILGLTGVLSAAVPIILIIVALNIMSHERIMKKSKLIMLSAFCLILDMLIHINLYFMINKGFSDYVKNSYLLGIKMKSGGAISGIFDFLLIKLIGIPGCWVVLLTALLVILIVMFNISLKKTFHIMKEKIEKVKLYMAALLSKENKTVKKRKTRTFKKLDENEDFNLDNIIHDSIEESLISEEKNTINRGEDKANGKFKVNKTETDYMQPPYELLMQNETKNAGDNKLEIKNNIKILEDTLSSFGVEAKVIEVSCGPAITRYELQPSPGIKVSRIVNLIDDISLSMATSGVRLEVPIPGKSAIGVEVPNHKIRPVFLREVLESKDFISSKSDLSIALGKDISGSNIIADLSKMPHMLIAGATGSGKSVCINTLITSLLYKSDPNKVKLLLVDPKVVELSVYNGIGHLIAPVVTDPKKAAGALNWAVQEMLNRYNLFAQKGVRDIASYNDINETKLPKIVVIIDELSDLMMAAPNEVEDAICRLAQMARAAGIHLVIATQRPSVDVITGVIKANIPSRISFAVSSQIDSRTILDMAGAEKLLGKGDMLYYPQGTAKPVRVQCCYISEKEVESVVDYLKLNSDTADYDEKFIEKLEETNVTENLDEDELLPQAINIIYETNQASVSLLQRKLKIGYSRAARLMDQMEQRGIVSKSEGNKPRQILKRN